MDELGFRSFLEADEAHLTENGIKSRISKGKKAEKIVGMNLDEIVSSDEVMLSSLEKLQEYEDPAHNNMQNAVRKYYIFRNGKKFPQKNKF